ncbi:MAG: hypothetical protein LUE13_10865, partial [Akkermansiaceae bacterium]|nr:hypothetical protein [Akkermansiaceae bacterium]
MNFPVKGHYSFLESQITDKKNLGRAKNPVCAADSLWTNAVTFTLLYSIHHTSSGESHRKET